MPSRTAVNKFIKENTSKVPDVELGEALYTCNELGLWPDDVEVSREQVLACWKLVEALRGQKWPEELRM